MRSAVALAAPLLMSLSEVARAADAAIADDGVLVVTAETIEKAIKDHEHLVVEFYAPCEYMRVCVHSSKGLSDLSTVRICSTMLLRCTFVLFLPAARLYLSSSNVFLVMSGDAPSVLQKINSCVCSL